MSKFSKNISIVVLSVLFFATGFIFLNINGETKAAPTVQKTLSVALIGDSFTAGNGAGSHYGPKGSYQSKNNWGHRYVAWLNSRGVKTTLVKNLAFSGNTADDVRQEQIENIPKDTDLVMLTVGGNDMDFEGAVTYCFAKGFRSPKDCREKVDYAKSQFNDAVSNTGLILAQLEAKLPSTSEVVLVGYPYLSIDTKDYVLEQCLARDLRANRCTKYDRYDAATAIRRAGKEFNNKQAELVNSWNINHGLKVSFVSNIQSAFASHEPDPSIDNKNPKRWLNEFWETEGRVGANGTVDSKYTWNVNHWYHPNVTGHQKIADQIAATIGIPSSAKTITPNSSDVDIAFVIDTTGSMGGAINNVKQNVMSIATEINNSARTTRFALVDFQDHPVMGGGPDDYPARVRLDFTSSPLELANAVQTLNLGYGGDWEESVYSGAMAALDLNWRPGVRKIMIIIGDAPAKDPEPVTGYTWQQVAQRAYDIDPVEVYSIDVAYGDLSSSIQPLVEQSGGQLLQGSNVSDTIIDAVEHSTNKPFAWVQGPYTVKAGDEQELDARASYVVDGDIVSIKWDLDGDGAFETSSGGLLYAHRFVNEFSGTIGVRITDSNGRIGIGSTQLDVTDDGDTIPRAIDNCPDTANQDQFDGDGDGIGDDCDSDIGWPTKDIEGVTVISASEARRREAEEATTAKSVPKGASSRKPISVKDTPAVLSATTNIPSTSQNPFLQPALIPKNSTKHTDRPFQKGNASNQLLLIWLAISGAIVIIGALALATRKQKQRPKR